MTLEVYDEKSDHDNPFIEPLFDLNIHKAKIKRTNEHQALAFFCIILHLKKYI